MDEKELGDRLSNIKHDEIELPEHRILLKRALFKFAQTKTTHTEKTGRFSLFPQRLTWQAAVAGVLTIVIIASLALALPSLTGQDHKVLAADIALASPEVKAALNGSAPEQVGVTDNINASGYSRVVMTMPPGTAVIADVDMQKREVIHVTTQHASDVTEQKVMDIAQSDPRVQALLKKGYTPFFDGIGNWFSTSTEVYEKFAYLKLLGVDPQELVGLIGLVSLYLYSPDFGGYVSWVNISLDKVVVFAYFGTQPNFTVNSTGPLVDPAQPEPIFVSPDVGSVSGVKPDNYEYEEVGHSPSQLVIAEIDKSTGMRTRTWTWNVTQNDIERILDIVKSNNQVQGLLAQGARFSSIMPYYSPLSIGGEHGINYTAWVTIDLGDKSYQAWINLTQQRFNILLDPIPKRTSFSNEEIVLP